MVPSILGQVGACRRIGGPGWTEYAYHQYLLKQNASESWPNLLSSIMLPYLSAEVTENDVTHSGAVLTGV